MCSAILIFVEPIKFIRETNENKIKTLMRRERSCLNENREMKDVRQKKMIELTRYERY